MKTEDWKIVKEVLQEVLPLDATQRQIFLDNSDIGDDVRREVESLLLFEDEAADLMNFPAVGFSKDFFADEDENNSLVGQNIGVYKIVCEIGEGGMGAVYLAERTDGKFKQKVALKLLKREMNTSALRRRFQQEREILASLEHPHIARLLDAGTTGDKIPFLAMEYVEGLPIDDYCNQHELDLNQRLDLFRKVCAAVNFAHRNLIVHRDLKPSNILVNRDGIPKLLDFGISKILSAEFEQINAATVTKLGAMTPSYASPEQLQNKSVTTATDVYSLGVILYELLSGHRPFESKESDLKEIYRAVLENEPPPPSAAISDFGFRLADLKNSPEVQTELKSPEKTGTPTKINQFELNTKADKLKRTNPKSASQNPKLLSGDLDNIVLKALRKEPERRYSSAENFADDIDRHQRGLPVTARPNTFSYRAEKFISRNRAGVFAGILISLTVIAGIAATLWQARVAQTERAKAERRFNDVRALANSFLFEFSPLVENLPGSTPARELLVRRALEYLDNLSQETGEDLQLQRELAAAYAKVGNVQGNPSNPNLGNVKGAIESFEKSRNIRQKLLDKNPENTTAQNDLADILKLSGIVYVNDNNYPEGVAVEEQSLALREKIVAADPQNIEARFNLADMLRTRGLIPFYQGDNKKALEYYNRAKEINERLYLEQPENPKIAEQYAYNFVAIGEAQGWDNDFQNAAKSLQTGLDLLIPLSEKYPNDFSIQRSVMLAHNKKAENYQDLKEFDKSIEFFSKGVQIAEKSATADPLNALAKRDVAMGDKKLAQALDDAGKSKESLETMMIALNIFKEIAAADPNDSEGFYNVTNTEFSVGETYLTLKDYDSALKFFQSAKQGFRSILEKNSANVYARRMGAYNLEGIAKSCLALAARKNRLEFRQSALENYQAAVEDFKKLKNDGNLGEVDAEIIDKLEKEIEKIKNSD